MKLILGSGARLSGEELADFLEKAKGGLAAGKKPADFDQVQLKMGMKVEMEHTDSKEKAQKIAMDHLVEDPKYYTKLAQMEAKKSKAVKAKAGKTEQAIRRFLEKNPRPDDHKVHALAGKLGMEVDDLEEKIYAMLGQKLKKARVERQPYKKGDRIRKGGPYVGPRGGKWADAKHTIPWKENGAKKKEKKAGFKTVETEEKNAKYWEAQIVKKLAKLAGPKSTTKDESAFKNAVEEAVASHQEAAKVCRAVGLDERAKLHEEHATKLDAKYEKLPTPAEAVGTGREALRRARPPESTSRLSRNTPDSA